MSRGRFSIPPWATIPVTIAVLASLWLTVDGRLHWDEPSYLYAGLYLDAAEIIAGEVQSSGIPDFMQGRILHALTMKALLSVLGPGETAFAALVAIYFALLVGTVLLAHAILRALLPDVGQGRAAVLLLAMTPVVLYMALKTMADISALAAATLATYALLRCASGAGMRWMLIAAASLACAALTKNQMVLMPAGFWLAACVVPVAGVDRARLLRFGAAAGIAGVVITVLVLEVLGIGIGRYLGSYTDFLGRSPPLAAKIMNIGTELGIFWLVVAAAVLSRRRRELAFLSLWMLFAMGPFLFVFGQIEARHLAVNLVAVGGLFALALEALSAKMGAWRRLPGWGKGAVATLAAATVLATHKIALDLIPYEVEIRPLRGLLHDLDERYGPDGYVVLTPWVYTDFHIVSVLWPSVDVRNVGAAVMAVRPTAVSRREALESYHRGRFLEDMHEVAAIGRPLIYVGYRDTFTIANFRAMAGLVAPQLAERMLAKLDLVDHLAESWLWHEPGVHFEPIAQAGQYQAFEVSLTETL